MWLFYGVLLSELVCCLLLVVFGCYLIIIDYWLFNFGGFNVKLFGTDCFAFCLFNWWLVVYGYLICLWVWVDCVVLFGL